MSFCGPSAILLNSCGPWQYSK